MELGIGRESSVGIASRYGMDGPGSNPGGDEIFRNRPQRPSAHPAYYAVGTGAFLGVKWPGRGADHPPPSNAQVKERVEL